AVGPAREIRIPHRPDAVNPHRRSVAGRGDGPTIGAGPESASGRSERRIPLMSDHESGIGRRIAYYRARKGLSQRDFAPLIKRSEAWVSQVERGVRPVKALDVLQRIADVLDMPVAELAPGAPTAGVEPIPAHTRALRLLLVTDHALAAAVAQPQARPDLDRLAEQVDK